jgi:hypothetical protein
MFTTRLLQPEVDYETGRVIARQEILSGNYREFYDVADKEKDYDLSLKRHRNTRSLNANSYFHVLCGKIADKIGSSKIEVKNRMISLYGQPYVIDGKLDYLIVRDSLPVEKWESIHLQPTAQTKVLKGIMYRVYINMRHTGKNDEDDGYDTQEMSVLINGTVSEAREIGLSEAEIMSPNEKRMLEERYGLKIDDRR